MDVKSKKRLNFREAIDQNIFDPDAGSFTNTATGERLEVGDAIRKGFIKVRFHRHIKTGAVIIGGRAHAPLPSERSASLTAPNEIFVECNWTAGMKV